MAVAFNLTSLRFPNGTSVGAYPQANWPTPGQPSGAPVGSATQSKTVTAGVAAFTTLEDEVAYWAVAEVGGSYRYVGFIAGEDLAEVDATGGISEAEAETLKLLTPNEQTGDYTAQASDVGKVIEVDAATLKVVTIPKGVFAVGTILYVAQMGAGAVEIAPAEGVTFDPEESFTLSGQYQMAAFRCRATDEWVTDDSMAAIEALITGKRDKAELITQRRTYSVLVPGEVKVPSGGTNYILPFFINVRAGEIVELVSLSRILRAGTKCKLKLRYIKPGGSIEDVTGFTALEGTTTLKTTTPTAVTLPEGVNQLYLVVESVEGTPEDLTISVGTDITVP